MGDHRIKTGVVENILFVEIQNCRFDSVHRCVANLRCRTALHLQLHADEITRYFRKHNHSNRATAEQTDRQRQHADKYRHCRTAIIDRTFEPRLVVVCDY